MSARLFDRSSSSRICRAQDGDSSASRARCAIAVLDEQGVVMDHDEWKQLVESQRQRKAAMVVPASDHLDRSRDTPLSKPGDVGWVMATATVQALIEHGVFTDVILSRIGELMLAVAETRSLEGRWRRRRGDRARCQPVRRGCSDDPTARTVMLWAMAGSTSSSTGKPRRIGCRASSISPTPSFISISDWRSSC